MNSNSLYSHLIGSYDEHASFLKEDDPLSGNIKRQKTELLDENTLSSQTSSTSEQFEVIPDNFDETQNVTVLRMDEDTIKFADSSIFTKDEERGTEFIDSIKKTPKEAERTDGD